MGGDAFLFLFFWFSQTKKTATGKDLIPQATQIVLNLFLFKDFFFLLRLTLDFVKEQLIETMLQHLCPGWNAHAKCTEFFCFVLFLMALLCNFCC